MPCRDASAKGIKEIAANAHCRRNCKKPKTDCAGPFAGKKMGSCLEHPNNLREAL